VAKVSVFKRYKGKRINSKDKNWSKGTWYVWRRCEGRIIHKAIPLAQTKEEAEYAERELIREAFDKRYGRGSKEKFGEFVERVYRKYVKQNNVNLGAKDLYIRLLSDVLGSQSLMDITPQDCRNIQAGFKKRYSASTVNLIMSTASKIFNLAGEEGILDKNPMQYVKRVKEPPPRDRLLSKEEWERLWAALESDFLMECLIILAVNLPLRKGQLLAITPDAVDVPNGRLSIIKSKGRAKRLVPLNSTAASTLTRMLNDGLLPFPLKETGIRKRFVKLLKKAGVSHFRFHDLRKEFASNLIRNNVNPEIVRQLFAHSSLAVTQAYTHSSSVELAEAVKTLDNIQETEVVQ
jgi:integrase